MLVNDNNTNHNSSNGNSIKNNGGWLAGSLEHARPVFQNGLRRDLLDEPNPLRPPGAGVCPQHGYRSNAPAPGESRMYIYYIVSTLSV